MNSRTAHYMRCTQVNVSTHLLTVRDDNSFIQLDDYVKSHYMLINGLQKHKHSNMHQHRL